MSFASPCLSTSQKSGYSSTTTSTSPATCPGATAKRFDRERASSHSLWDSDSQEPQFKTPHSHRKPAVGRPLLIDKALRSLSSRYQASLNAMRRSRELKGRDSFTRPRLEADGDRCASYRLPALCDHTKGEKRMPLGESGGRRTQRIADGEAPGLGCG
jgi:hypothetical protein